MLDKLQKDDFAAHVGEIFAAHLPETPPIPLVLALVGDLGAAQAPADRRPFSLLFLGPQSRVYLQQGTYHLENGALGGLDIFLVPLGPVSGRPQPGGAPAAQMQYEAVFN